MRAILKGVVPVISLLFSFTISAQEAESSTNNNNGMFSLGGRSTVSAFDHDGTGIGTGGQFRIRLSDRINTEWYADYISINVMGLVRSEYAHIGWSVMFYPFNDPGYQSTIQPYIIAGHCFDHNKKTILEHSEISFDRWGSAVQAGLGTHVNITERFDISLSCQYMIHLTKSLEVYAYPFGDDSHYHTEIREHDEQALEGHLLATLSMNYKIGRLWGNK